MKATLENVSSAFEREIENLEREVTFEDFEDIKSDFDWDYDSTDEENEVNEQLNDWFYDNEDRLNDIYNEAAAYEAETPSLSEYWFGNY